MYGLEEERGGNGVVLLVSGKAWLREVRERVHYLVHRLGAQKKKRGLSNFDELPSGPWGEEEGGEILKEKGMPIHYYKITPNPEGMS